MKIIDMHARAQSLSRKIKNYSPTINSRKKKYITSHPLTQFNPQMVFSNCGDPVQKYSKTQSLLLSLIS